VRSAYDPSLLAVGKPAELEVLGRGAESPDTYRPTPDELYYLGKALFDDGHFKRAEEKLETLFTDWSKKLQLNIYKDTARMLLFLNITLNRPRSIVKYFEIIKEKYPDLYIPFDRVLSVGAAYRVIEEYERALLVFRAAIGETFGKGLKVAGTLEEEGEFFGAVETLEKLWITCPDLPVVVNTFLTLSDMFYLRAEKPVTTSSGDYIIEKGDTLWSIAQKFYGKGSQWNIIAEANVNLNPDSLKQGARIRIPGLSETKEQKKPELSKEQLLKRAASVLFRFFTLYAEDPQADQAALSLVGTYMKLEDYEAGSALAGLFADRFPESNLNDHFVYSEAVARWYLDQYTQAVKLAEEVSTRKYTGPDGRKHFSENRNLALYILGQIHHAQKKIEQAVAYYDKVRTTFPDAEEAIRCFREKQLALPEVTAFQPGKGESIALTFRNIETADMLIYPVDLMTLYLREKNLSKVTDINLSGISPVSFMPGIALGTGKDYTEKEKKIEPGLKEPGAYLVIVRGGELHTSGLVLVTPLFLEVNEDAASGRVRVQVMQRDDKSYVRDVNVKVIGSQDTAFTSGKSDPRGLFIADNINGKATVIARAHKDVYAFYRGTADLRGAERKQEQQALPQGKSRPTQTDYFDNIDGRNTFYQLQRGKMYQKELKKTRKGVQAKDAY
jgi:hypothetical protein